MRKLMLKRFRQMGTESNGQSSFNFDEADDVMHAFSLLFVHWLFDCYCILRSLDLAAC